MLLTLVHFRHVLMLPGVAPFWHAPGLTQGPWKIRWGDLASWKRTAGTRKITPEFGNWKGKSMKIHDNQWINVPKSIQKPLSWSTWNVTASKSTYSHLPKHLSGTTTTAFVFVAASFHYFCWNLWVFWILNRVPFHPIPFNIINPTTSTGTHGFFPPLRGRFHLQQHHNITGHLQTTIGASKDTVICQKLS